MNEIDEGLITDIYNKFVVSQEYKKIIFDNGTFLPEDVVKACIRYMLKLKW